VTVDPSGRFAYVANEVSDDISGYRIDASSGVLTPLPGSPFAAGSLPISVTVEPSGRFAYVANANSNTISGYTIDASTGVLTPLPGSPFAAGSGPTAVIASGTTQ
jgi:6-phosphogluconolactonase (cycloisomerase 2 family)